MRGNEEKLAVYENKIKKIRKLDKLQGFVTGKQILEVCSSAAEAKILRKILVDEGISVNSYVNESRKEHITSAKKVIQSKRGITHYNDPTWVYLNNVGKTPLLSKEEEIEYATQIEMARNKMFSIAFELDSTYETIYNISSKFTDNTISITDIFDVEESILEDEEECELLIDSFKKKVALIKRKNTKIKKLQKENSNDVALIESNSLKIKKLRQVTIELCRNLGLNRRQIDSILDKFKSDYVSSESKEIKSLYRKFLKWERAYNHAKYAMIESNVRLVVSIAKKYLFNGMEIIDIIQEGNSGLIKAVDNFDYHKGYKFSTYATWWIRQAITRAINDKAKTIRIPANTLELVNKTIRYCKDFVSNYGIEPTIDEIARALHTTNNKVKMALDFAHDPISLDMEASAGSDVTVGEYIEDKKAVDPSMRVSLQVLRETIGEALDSLPDKEREVLTMRFGLDDGRIKTLKEIGSYFNISRERVRQIETKALAKLKHPSRTKNLMEWRVNREETFMDYE